MAHLHLIISGRVQGVCFRAYTQERAAASGLTGWVKNLPGGEVEIVACGEPRQLERFREWCRRGPPAAHVSEITEIKGDNNEVFQGFTIRY